MADHTENQDHPESAADECIWSPPGSCRQRIVQRRLALDNTAVIRLISLAADVHGHIVDISLGGCRIRTEQRFPLGVFRRVEVQFRVEGLPFRLGGVTQAIYDPFNVGIRFLDLSDRKREQLLQLIEEMNKAAGHPEAPKP
ncbi:MAG TPA: PilZ domain-containing protein [Terracidiphilus sp.]